MRQQTKYVGIDVHQQTLVVVVLDPTGKVVLDAKIPTSAEAVVDFVGGLNGTIWVAFEEGTQAEWLYGVIAPRVARVVVCDGRRVRKIAQNQAKAD